MSIFDTLDTKSVILGAAVATVAAIVFQPKKEIKIGPSSCELEEMARKAAGKRTEEIN